MINKKRLIITSVISIILVSTLLFSSTYAIFTTTDTDEDLNVYKTGNLDISYTLSESNVELVNNTPMNEEEADGITPYRITVTNNGTVSYMFDLVLIDSTATAEVINYQYIMTKVGYVTPKRLSSCTNNVIKEDIILLPGESVDIDVRVWIADDIANSEMGKSFYATLSIDGLAVYNDNEEINNDVLSLRYMKTLFTDSNNYQYYRSVNYISQITTAQFVDYIDTTNAISTSAIWDVSEKGDNSVVAWLENSTTTGYYDLYIGANQKIYPTSMYNFFSEMTYLESITFNNLDTSLVTNMSYMFWDCVSLTSLSLSNFDTSKVIDMESMFDTCVLTNLDLSNFNTSNVTNMSYMFNECNNLVNLDLSNFDTSKVTDMSYMFENCASLTSLDLSDFTTNKVTSMRYMFENCVSLTSLDLSNFNTGNVTNMASMFLHCDHLTSLDLSNFDTSKVTNMSDMFYNCSSLTSLDLSNFNTSNVTHMNQMFRECTNLISLDISNFDTSNVTGMNCMFYGCSKLSTTITIRNANVGYTVIFYNAATQSGAKITVHYNSATHAIIDNIISTKSTNSNVVKGKLEVW